MQIINTCERIKECFRDGFSVDVWRKYANEISQMLSSKCEADAEGYNFENDIAPVLENALDVEKIDFVNRNFQAVINTLEQNITKLFDTDPDVNIILYLGLCNGAGWATTLDGNNCILLGIEKIIELNWGDESNMRALILHEMGHLWHKQNGNYNLLGFTKRRKSMEQLYCEGVAMVCEQILCGDEFYHQDKNGWLEWCRENECEIKKEFLRRLDEKADVSDFFGDWCSYNGYSDVGYFLGCRFVRYLMRTHTLKEIANMKYNFLNKAYTEYAGTVIELLRSEEYHRCSNIWNMKAQPLAEVWLEEIKSGNRLVFVYKINGEFIGEGALVLNTNDPDYTIPGKRVYVSRMIVKEKYRGRGIGSAILSFLIEKAEKMGFEEMTIGVDKDNKNALHMYQKYGFSEILFEGADENGEYFKLMKKLV